jgi:predicted NBD/HSP70 family sugar kinase
VQYRCPEGRIRPEVAIAVRDLVRPDPPPQSNGDASDGLARPRRSVGELDSLASVLRLVRSEMAGTRLEIENLSGLGRGIVADRLATLIGQGLIEEGDLGPSNGGRAPRQARFRPEAGHVLVGAIGHTSLGAGLADLSGHLLVEHHEPSGVDAGAAYTLGRLEKLFEWMLSQHPVVHDLWGIGLAVPGPVELPGGLNGSESIVHISPDWAESPFSEQLGMRFGAPVWVDNDAHLMALGELRAGRGVGQDNLLFLKIGSGISAGLCWNSQIHRGARGYAGDIGHVVVEEDGPLCRCGNSGCLEAVAGGVAIAREAAAAAADGRSPYLAELAAAGRTISASDVGNGAYRGDPYCVESLARVGQVIGRALAMLVNAYNPSLVIIGGGVAQAGEIVIAAMREAFYRRSRSLATRDVTIARSGMGRTAGLVGAAFAVVDDLFSMDRLRTWVGEGTPVPWVETRTA